MVVFLLSDKSTRHSSNTSMERICEKDVKDFIFLIRFNTQEMSMRRPLGRTVHKVT